jgi:anti-anti-sigma factor
MTAAIDPRSHFLTLPVEGPLRAPVSTTLRHGLETLLRRGERRVVLDLARLSALDAAGIGELMRAFAAVSRAGGVLRIAHASRHVHRLLQVTGVLALLNPGVEER